MSSFFGIALAVLAVTGPAPAADSPGVSSVLPAAPPIYLPGTKLYVNASGLAFRRGPSLETERIHYITRGDAVTVLEDNRVPVSFEAEGIQGHWIYVQHGAYKGYAFDGFLSPDPPPAENRADWTFVPGKRFGPITAQTTYEDLAGLFGAANLEEALVELGEGDSEPGTAVFPNSPDRIVIQWEKYQQRPKAVHVRTAGGKWKSVDGIAIGTPIETLVQLNGRPFAFAGLGSDESGWVKSWKGGALEKGYAIGKLFEGDLAPTEPYNQDDYPTLLGDAVLTSDLAAVSRLRLRLVCVVVYLAPPAEPPPSGPGSPVAPVETTPIAPGTQLYVLASKLNMRSQPALGADVVASIPYGASVMAAQDQTGASPLVAEGMRGHWVAIDFSGQRGFGFDAYLSPLPSPRSTCVSLLDYARTSLEPQGEPRKKDTSTAGTTTTIQEYKQEVRLEYRTSTAVVANDYQTSLVIPGMSLEQAFVLAKRCVPAFAQVAFPTGVRDSVSLKNGGMALTIRREPDGSVRITETNAPAPMTP